MINGKTILISPIDVQVHIDKLDDIESYDIESAHAKADEFLLAALEDLGLKELSAAWEGVERRCSGFWYA